MERHPVGCETTKEETQKGKEMSNALLIDIVVITFVSMVILFFALLPTFWFNKEYL